MAVGMSVGYLARVLVQTWVPLLPVGGWGDADSETGFQHGGRPAECQDPGQAVRGLPHALPAQALWEDWRYSITWPLQKRSLLWHWGSEKVAMSLKGSLFQWKSMAQRIISHDQSNLRCPSLLGAWRLLLFLSPSFLPLTSFFPEGRLQEGTHISHSS